MSNSNSSKTYSVKREQIPVETFEKLWAELQRELHEKYQLTFNPNSRNASRFFGMNDFSPSLAPGLKTVASVIANHGRVKEFLSEFPKESAAINFGDFLSKRLRDIAKAKHEVVTFGRRAYVYGYFLFLGFQNMEEFEIHHGLKRKTIPPLTRRSPSKHIPVTYYLGSFYHFRTYTIQHFVIRIDFNAHLNENVFRAQEWGFHQLENNKEHATDDHEKQVQQSSLTGTARIRDNILYVNLVTPDSEQNWTQMNIMGWSFGAQPDHIMVQRIIRCNIQTVSVQGNPIAAEAVLVRIDDSKWAETGLQEHQVPTSPVIRTLLGEAERDTLMLYLMLQRRNFWIKNETIESLLDLRVRGNQVQNFRYLRGRWRIWNYGLKRDYVIQSKLTINEHFASTFSPYLKPDILKSNPRLKNQAATLSISEDVQPDKLFFHTYVKPNLTIINTAIFDLGTIKDSTFAEGIFLSGGYDSQGIIGGYCVMKKLDRGEADFEPCEFTLEEALAYEDMHNIKGLYEGLRNLWRRKIRPRRKDNGKANTETLSYTVID